MTRVSKEGCPSSANDADNVVSSKMGSSSSERQFDGNFSSGKFKSTEESRTCNICAIPVSSSMDSKQVASLVGTDELSDEAFKGMVDVRRSFIDTDLLSPSLSSTGRHCSSSETSNFLSACSSHDSLSENSESKATLRASGNFEDRGVHATSDICQIDREIGGVARSPIIHQGQIFLNQLEKLKKLECLGDNISSISGSDYTNLMVGNHNDDANMKKISCGLASVNTFTASGKTFNGQSVRCGLAVNHFDEVNNSCPRTPVNFIKDSSQEIGLHSNKSNESEASSLTNVYPNPSSQQRCPELSEEQVESSVIKTLTFGHNIGESAISVPEMNHVDPEIEALKCSDQKSCHEKSDVMVEEKKACLVFNSVNYNDGSDNLEDVNVCDICGDAGREDLLATCSTCIDGAEHIYCMRVKLEKVPEANWMCEECVLMEKSKTEKGNKFVKTDRSSEGSVLNELRKNYGNSGTISFKNNLEANIIVPGVEESRKKVVGSTSCFSVKRSAGSLEVMSVTKRRAVETSVKSPRVSTLCSKSVLCSDSSYKNLNKEKIRAAHDATSGDQSFGSIAFPSVSADKSTKFQPQSRVIQGSLFKSKSFEITRLTKKGKLSDGSHVQKQKNCKDAATSDHMKKGAARTMCKSLSFNNMRAGHTNSTDSPVKMKSHFEDLKKSKHASEENTTSMKYRSKLGKLSDGSHVQKKKICKNAATGDGMKKEATRTMRKSMSFNNMKAEHWKSTDSTVKMQFHFEDLKKSKHASEEENTTQMKYRSKSGNPLMSSPMASSVGVAVKSEKKNSSIGRTMSVHLSGSTCQDLKDDHKQVDLTRKSSKCLNDEENKAVNDVRQHVDLSTEAAHAIRENNSYTSRECDLNVKREENPNATFPSDGFHCLKSSATIPYPVSAIPHLDYIWKGGFEILRNGRSSGSCHGIQAHISTFASPKVHEVARRIPQEILVEEVSQLSTWPKRFPKDYASEDNIALYFFAEDFESYRRNYKILLEFLISNNLALKANLDGVELLIFPSNLLPEKLQRWNTLLFLWGVFKGQWDSYSEELKSSGGLPQIVSAPKGKGEPKQKQEMDNKSDLQCRKEYSTTSMRVEGETESKKAKKCLSGTCERNSCEYTIHRVDGFPFQINSLDSKFAGEGLVCGGAYDMFISTKQQALTINDGGHSESVEKRVLTADHVDQPEPAVPNLELSLGPARTSMKQELMPLFPSVTEKKNHESKSRLLTDNENGYDDDFSTSLSLSLSLT